jgi:hypothetical protein
MKISLYLKTHNQTGLQYLGKTTQDPFTYKGSGSYWRKHIAKHGNDVTTTILFESINNQDINVRWYNNKRSTNCSSSCSAITIRRYKL